MSAKDAAVQLDVDIANPGQFFACCGLLELADRLWQGAEGWFNKLGNEFYLRPIDNSRAVSAESFLSNIKCAKFESTLEARDKERLEELENRKAKDLIHAMKEEKGRLIKRRKVLAMCLEDPFSMRIDWFRDKQSGGRRFKTWAGQQSVYDIGIKMKGFLDDGSYDGVPTSEWLHHTCGQGVPFYFDASIGAHSSVLDVGFSTDSLQMSTGIKPLLEFAAFVGLQRFRPAQPTKANSHLYCTWTLPACPKSASIAASGVLAFPDSHLFVFPLLFRTDYLKSFLPAQPFTR